MLLNEAMKTHMPLVQLVCAVVGLAGLMMTSAGCETRERVVVHDRPAVRVYERPPVVQERVIVR